MTRVATTMTVRRARRNESPLRDGTYRSLCKRLGARLPGHSSEILKRVIVCRYAAATEAALASEFFECLRGAELHENCRGSRMPECCC